MRSGGIVATPLLGLLRGRSFEKDRLQLLMGKGLVFAGHGEQVIVSVVRRPVVVIWNINKEADDEGDEGGDKER
jgi:hypothetical protein